MNNNIIIIFRTLINDIDETQFSDETLNRLAVVAALMVAREVHFTTTYTVNLATVSISPDPDNDFSLFVAYKAAILLLQAELRKYSYKNIKIQDGPSTIDFANIVSSIKDNLASFLDQYTRMKYDYGLSGTLGHVILTPTTVSTITGDVFE